MQIRVNQAAPVELVNFSSHLEFGCTQVEESTRYLESNTRRVIAIVCFVIDY
jgi:hypothetical protein